MLEFAKMPLQRYADFSGRSRRSEFWYWVLAVFLVQVVATIVDVVIGARILSTVIALATIVPNIAVAVRRLHDTGRSGWWYFIALVPLVGAILLIVWFATEGDSGPNQYGPDPKGGTGGGQWGQGGYGQGGYAQGGYEQAGQWGQDPSQQWGQPQPQQPQWGQPSAPPQPAAPQGGGWDQPPAPPAQGGGWNAPQQDPQQGGWNQPSGGGWNSPG